MKSIKKTCKFGSFLIALLFAFTYSVAQAQESICARVKIEIKQELTLERQAFDANMVINNGLQGVSLENVAIDVLFSDENGVSVLASSDPNNLDASFFIRIDSMDGINDVEGNGVVAPLTSADIHWLIIPAPGSGGTLPSGKLYYVGAKLSYTINGEPTEMEVSPDYIYVKPLPELTLDYFLPEDVYADDAFTTEIEAPVPFTLGVRISNNGDGPAQNVKIESAQPEIVENEQGLIIDFRIEGSTVQDEPTIPSLLIDFGTIEKDASSIGRWSMITTLSGKFVEFEAEFTHSDELGGQLTSLIEAVNTHTLIHDVLVDLPGRDSVRDFLAEDAQLRVYESNNTDTVVSDVSGSSSLSGATVAGSLVRHSLNSVPAAGFTYIKIPDPYSGTKAFLSVIRSDGKILPAANAWTSKTRKAEASEGWDYFLNFFDVGSTGQYTLDMDTPIIPELPPVMQFIPDRTVAEGTQVSFLVEASDPNGTIPSLSTSELPGDAVFVDEGTGTGYLDWTPSLGSAGTYPITFIASDGTLKTSQYTQIFVEDPATIDSDGDGIPDQWEMDMFGSLDRDGSGDFDGDGISDLDEYLNGSDPLGLDGPSTPVILSPAEHSIVSALPLELAVENSAHPLPDAIVTYEFEIYRDKTLAELLASDSAVLQGEPNTLWPVLETLPENTELVWRVRAFDGVLASQWAYSSFVLNTLDEAATAPRHAYPGASINIDKLQPVFEVTNGFAPDKPLGVMESYVFEVSDSAEFISPLIQSSAIALQHEGRTQWTPPTALTNGLSYYWRVAFLDYDNLGTPTTKYTTPQVFTIDINNAAPDVPVVLAPSMSAEIGLGAEYFLRVQSQQLDSDGDTLNYYFELDTVATFNSSNLQSSLALVPDDATTTTWTVNGLQDDQTYYWRAKASDGASESPWMYAQFTVNSTNDAPRAAPSCNPGANSWSPSIRPVLRLADLLDLEGDSQEFEFELTDLGTGQVIATHQVQQLFWRMPAGELNDHSWYQWRARAVDEHGTYGPWSDPQAFYINEQNQLQTVPSIQLLAPSLPVTNPQEPVLISWVDKDDDDDALISLFYDSDKYGVDGSLIVADLSEDADGSDGSYLWDISALAPSTYYVYGQISDGSDSTVSYASGSIKLLAEEIADADEDGIADEVDNCPNVANADQSDRGGLDTNVADGVGDVCQCGDVNGDGIITGTDAVLIKRFVLNLPPPIQQNKCDVNQDGQCTNTDAVLIQRALLGLPPGIPSLCY